MDTTVLIPAWNAEAYIERALESIHEDVAVVLIDDFSSDRTVERAQSVGLKKLRILRPSRKECLGLVRQTALDAVETPYAVWLDADDAFLPGRIGRMLMPLRAGIADFVSDSQELVDGASGTFIRDLSIPGFISEDRDKVRLFERNWLPGIAHVAFRTEIGRQIGYDTKLHGGDDSDFVWRAIAAGAKFEFIHQKGYRMYAYVGSDSRNVAKQRAMVARALKKHRYADVKNLYLRNGFSEQVTLWGLCSMALFRGEMDEASKFLKLLEPNAQETLEVLEPAGPYPVLEAWRFAFTEGTLSLLNDRWTEALPCLERAVELHRSADALNNLGVTLKKLGESSSSDRYFEEAEQLFPGYLDARLNRESKESFRVTVHPLRMQASRSDY